MYGRPPQEHRVPTTIVDTNLCARNLATKQERSRWLIPNISTLVIANYLYEQSENKNNLKNGHFWPGGEGQFGVLVLCYIRVYIL